MAAAGDMTVVLNADETRMVAGLKRAEEAARRSGAAIGSSFASGAGRGVQQVGFMIQDFTSIMQNGGAGSLGRAFGAISNNVAMLGASMGPWGAAISAVGGALAGILIPEMIKAGDVLDGYGKKVEDAIAQTDKMAERLKRGIEFEQQLRNLQDAGTEKEVRAAQQKNVAEQEAVSRELELRRMRLRQGLDEAFQTGAAFPTRGVRRPGMNAAGQFDPTGRFVGDVTFDPGSGDAVKAGEAFQKELERIKELEDRQERLGRREGALKGLDEVAKKRELEKKMIDDLAKKQKEYDDELFNRAKKMERETRTPEEKHAANLRDIKELYMNSSIDTETMQRAASASFLELGKQKSSQGAAMFGSSEAISAMVRAEANNSKQQDTYQLMKQFVEEMKELKRINQEIERNTANNEVVEIGG